MSIENLKQKFLSLKESNPKIYLHDAAKVLQTSEAQLLALNLNNTVISLRPEMKEIVSEISKLGRIMALTRNDSCVHECKGKYANLEFYHDSNIGLMVNPDMDLRFFLNHWHFAFAINEENRKGLQFFDKAGNSVHKIFLTPESNTEEFFAIVEKYKSDNQITEIDTKEIAKRTNANDEDVNWDGLREEWSNLADIHDFYKLLGKHNVHREQAFRNVGVEFAYQVENDSVRKIITAARDEKCTIILFVGNVGCIQISTDIPENIVDRSIGTDNYFNIMDKEVTMHLLENHIKSTWISKKNSEGIEIVSIDAFDKDNNIILSVFGKRLDTDTTCTLWKSLVQDRLTTVKNN